MVTMMIREGTQRDMRFRVCQASKALGSVSQMCRTGHRVVFNPPWEQEGSFIEHVEIGERMWLEERGGLYILKPKVAPRHKQTCMIQNEGNNRHQDFQWQGYP